MNFGWVPMPIPKELWRACERLLMPALVHGNECDVDDVVCDLRTGDAQLWIARDDEVRGACVTRAGEGEVQIWLMGGSLACIPHIVDIEAAAKTAGYSVMAINGRKGWQRVLKSYGWRATHDGLRKVLI